MVVRCNCVALSNASENIVEVRSCNSALPGEALLRNSHYWSACFSHTLATSCEILL